MVDFKLEDLDLKSTFNLDDLNISKPVSRYSTFADLDLDTRISDVARDKQQDVIRLYDVFEQNPQIVETYKSKLNRGENPVIDSSFLDSVFGPTWYQKKELKNDIFRFKKLAGTNIRGYTGKNIGSYPPTELKKKFYLDDKYDVYNRGLALSETESIPYLEEKLRAGIAGIEKGVKGVGLLLAEGADVAAGTDFTDWLDENWETVDTGGGFNKVLDVFGQFGLGYGAGLKIISSIRSLKTIKRGKALEALGVSPKASKIAGRMGYYSLPGFVGDFAVMNPEDKQFGEIFDAYSVGNPDNENLTNREKALARLSRRSVFGLEGAILGAGIAGIAKPLIKGTGKLITTKVKDIPLGIGETAKRQLISSKGDAFLDPFGRSIAESSLLNIPFRTVGAAMDVAAVVTAPLLGAGARGIQKTISKSGLPPYEKWRFFSTTGDSWGKSLLKRIDNTIGYIRTSKDLFRETFDLKQLAEGEVKAIENILRRSFNDLDKNIRGAVEKSLEDHGTKNPQQFEHIVEDLVEYFKGAIGGPGAKGKFLNELPLNLREPSAQIYSALEKLKKEAKVILKEDQAAYDSLLDNIKQHFNQSYRAFRNPKFKPDPKIKEQAINEFEKFIKKQRFYNVEAQLNPRGSAIAIVDEILKAVGTTKGSSLELIEAVASKLPDNFPVAKPGEILPDVVKKLLGGPKDPKTMLLDVVSGLSNSVWKHHLHDTLFRTGKGKWIFDNAEALINSGISNRRLVEITKEDFVGKNSMFKLGDNAMVSNPEAGRAVFVTPEMKKALLDDSLLTDDLLKIPVYREFLMLKASSQYSKTVLSLMTQVRNVTSAFMFPMANGHVGGGASYVDAYRQIVRDLFGRTGGIDSKKLDELGAELERVGILNSSVVVRDMQDMFKAIAATDPIKGFKLVDDDAFMKFLTESPVMKKLTDLYQAGDIIHKIYGYQFTKSQYKASFQNIDEIDTFFKEVIRQPFDRKNLNGTIKTMEEAIQEAAGKTLNNTYPNYNLIPTLVKELRRMPFGNFISFGSEMLRTTGNIANYALRELGSSNPYVRQIGAKRLMGLTSVFAVAPVSTAVALKALGMTEEQLDAIKRNNTAPWNKFSNLIPYSFDPLKGEVKYINLSYSNPYEIIQQPIYTMFGINEQSNLEKRTTKKKATDMAISSFQKLFSPFISEAIIAQAVFEAVRGKTRRGSTIWNADVDGPGGVTSKMFNHVIKALVPTTFVNLKRVEQGFIRQDDATNHRGYNKSGKPVDLKEELLALLAGIRLSKVNIYENIDFTVNDFNTKIDGIRSYTNSKQYKNLNYNDKLIAYYDGNIGKYGAFNELAVSLMDAAVIGQIGDPDTAEGKKQIVKTFNQTMRKLKEEIKPRLTKKERNAFKIIKIINDNGDIETVNRGNFVPLTPLNFLGDAVRDTVSEIENATVSGSYPIIEQKRIFNGLRNTKLGLSPVEFENIMRKALGLQEIKIEQPEEEQPTTGSINLDTLDLSKTFPIVQPVAQMASNQMAVSPVAAPTNVATKTTRDKIIEDDDFLKGLG